MIKKKKKKCRKTYVRDGSLSRGTIWKTLPCRGILIRIIRVTSRSRAIYYLGWTKFATLHKFHKPNEKLYRLSQSPRHNEPAKFRESRTNPAAHNSTGRRKKGSEDRAERTERGRGDKPKPTVPFGRNSAKSGKIESRRKPDRQRDEEEWSRPSDRLGTQKRARAYKPGQLLRHEEKEAFVRGASGMMNRFY